MKRLAPVLLAGLSACSPPRLASVSRPAASPSVLFSDVDVFDGERMVRSRDVLVSSGVIEAVGPEGTLAASPKAVVVDGRGKTLLPGLVDIHVHFVSAGLPYWDLRRPDQDADGQAALYAGVTTVLIANGARDEVRYGRRAAAGDVLAPRVFLAGPALGNAGGHPGRLTKALLPWPFGAVASWFLPTASDPEEARAEVRRVKRTVDPPFFKVMYDDIPPGAPQMSAETLKAAVSEAKALGMRTLVHVGKPSDMVDACDAGAALLMHTAYKDRLTDAQAARVRDSGIPFVTTMRIFSAGPEAEKGGTSLERELVGPAVLESFRNRPKGWRIEGFEGMESEATAYTENIRANILKLAGAGVPFFAGTDTGLMGLFPGGALHEELKGLVAIGLPPERVLRAATSAPADFLDATARFGRVKPGQVADLLLVEGDPTADIAALDRVDSVYLGGARLEREAAPR